MTERDEECVGKIINAEAAIQAAALATQAAETAIKDAVQAAQDAADAISDQSAWSLNEARSGIGGDRELVATKLEAASQCALASTNTIADAVAPLLAAQTAMARTRKVFDQRAEIA